MRSPKNKVADALSRLNDTSQFYQISMVISSWQQEVIGSYEEDEHAYEVTPLSIDSQAIIDHHWPIDC